MPGMSVDSQTFLADAAHRGAVATCVYDTAGLAAAEAAGLAAVQLANEGTAYADAVWRLCDVFFDHPTRDMAVVGVTGTNGKTTTAWMLRDMLQALGVEAAYLGTLGFQMEGECRELPNTTPYAVELYNLIAEARARGAKALAMEVSSHALAQHRVDGIEFDAAIFTNLTQDHLDFHGTMDAYEEAKFRLFAELPGQTAKAFVAAFDRDDEVGDRWAQRFHGPQIGFGRRVRIDLWSEKERVAVDRIEMDVCFGPLFENARFPIAARLGGGYNVDNLLAAVAGLLALGHAPAEAVKAVEAVRPVPGRFEPVANDAGIGIIVDYAHTPDALCKLLETVRDLARGRVITVFGCGGDRDRPKRPLMAAMASRLSDLTVITSDNPRTEDPRAILDETLAGIVGAAEAVAIVDRREAVAFAIKAARSGDVVVIAGKGHENYQIIGRHKYPMDDRELAQGALAGRVA